MQGTAQTPIYLDYNATTPVFPEVVEAMRACWSEPHLNPASQHGFGRRAHRTLEDARDQIAELLGANASGARTDRLIFTSGGTESNNLAIRGLLPLPARHADQGEGRVARNSPWPGEGVLQPHVVSSAIEHPSIATLTDHLSRTGYSVDRLSVDRSGVIRSETLPPLLRPETRVVAAMLANNETGVLQPVDELTALCSAQNIPLHTDAAQAAGKLPLSFGQLGVATMAIAAHKFGGPVGIGALLVRSDVQLAPLLHGGVQQMSLRPGTESVALVVGMRTALELWEKNRREWVAHIEKLRDEFESILTRTDQSIEIIGKQAERLPTTSNVAFLGLDRQALFVALDQAGIACSTGSACASGSSEPSPVHLAMGLDPDVISSTLRFSFGVQSTRAEVAESADRILRICNNLRGRKLAGNSRS
jgi:cysteine desulfurase